ncbi:5,10-methenyltetrahydrofolate synthetase [Puccinia graminis f. sp. tritici]|uniref:5-formyltetrahydrofolate cyclo-ligase n=1 Tax=Puccinia graminis f. sp. tritici TaxID=56615 RepID=A0A5B0ME15_PUCGR|nr:5,10-methenyltetrahydrofolate synthetase [Puccinia graminis f. sp. tritici]
MAHPPSVACFSSSATDSSKPTYQPPPSIGRQKLLIRRQIRTVLKEITSASLAHQGEEVLKHLKNLNHYIDSNRVSCYKSMSSGELPTDSIIKNLLEKRKRVFLPYIHHPTETADQKKIGTHRMEMLGLESWVEFETGLVPVSFSSSSSSPQVFQFDPAKISGLENALPKGLDLILLPGLAFDRHGNRLGHGKGYYDEYLNEYTAVSSRTSIADQSAKHQLEKPKAKEPILVGICLREQVLPKEEYIPTQAHDRRLDYLISPDGVLSFAS